MTAEYLVFCRNYNAPSPVRNLQKMSLIYKRRVILQTLWSAAIAMFPHSPIFWNAVRSIFVNVHQHPAFKLNSDWIAHQPMLSTAAYVAFSKDWKSYSKWQFYCSWSPVYQCWITLIFEVRGPGCFIELGYWIT